MFVPSPNDITMDYGYVINTWEHHSCSRVRPHQTNIQSSVHSLHHDGRWPKVQELHWPLYPAFGTGSQRRFESLNHCSQPKFGPWNSGFLQIDSTLNSVPMAAATNPIRSSSHVEAKPSMPVVSKKHAKRREKNQKIDRLSELPTWEGCSGATSIGLSSSKSLCCILHLQGRDI